MKHALTTIIALIFGLSGWAQKEVEDNSLLTADVTIPATSVSVDSSATYTGAYIPFTSPSLSLQQTPTGWQPSGMASLSSPYLYPTTWGMDYWDIHPGFNANIGAGVACGFGKNNPYRGAAFFTDVHALYALPVNNRLTLAAGMGYTHYTGWGSTQGALEIFGMANYRINTRLDATVFLSHSFGPLGGNNRNAFPYIPTISSACTTIGANMGIKVKDNMKVNVGISVTREEMPTPFVPHAPMEH